MNLCHASRTVSTLQRALRHTLILAAAALPLCLASCNSGEEQKRKLESEISAAEARATDASNKIRAAERKIAAVAVVPSTGPVPGQEEEMERVTATNDALKQEQQKLADFISRWEATARP